MIPFIVFLSADKLRMKAVRTWWPRAQGWALAIFTEAMAMSEQSGGKIKQPVVLTDLQGKGHERKEAFLLT
jgi:hypothetical protein